jgi:hypothetical protein
MRMIGYVRRSKANRRRPDDPAHGIGTQRSDEARRFLEATRAAGDPFYAAYVLVLVLGFSKGRGTRAHLG